MIKAADKTLPAIGLLGGAFDPIHHGHLRMALDALEALHLDQVRFIPTAVPPHRADAQLAFAQRCEMVRLAIANEPRFALDALEGDRTGPSYSVDTLTTLRATYPEHRLIWLIGTDAFAKIDHWHRWQECLEVAEFAVLHRPNNVIKDNDKTADVYPELPPNAKVHHININPLAISSTEIRHMLSEGRSPRYLLPAKVANYIEQQQCYR